MGALKCILLVLKFPLESGDFKAQTLFSSHGGFLTFAMYRQTVQNQTCKPNIYVSWCTSELRVRLAPWNRFKPSSKIFLLTFQGGTSFVDHLCYVYLVFVMLSRLFIAALWSPAVSRLVDEAIPLDHPRRYASRVIRWYDLIHSAWYSTPHQVTIMIMCMYWFYALPIVLRERSGSVVECLTRDRRVAGSSLTGVTALWSLSKTHLS